MNLHNEYLRIRSGLFFKLAPYTWLDDKFKIEYLFYKVFGDTLDLRHPKTFNEKLQWIKLYDRNPIYTKLADKFAVRAYVEHELGKQYIKTLLGVYDSIDEIDWKSLPRQFVIKATHGSHWNVFCFDKANFDFKNARKKITAWMKHNYYWGAREWQYKNICPRIIIEEYITDGSGLLPKDFQVYCFNGKAEFIRVIIGRGSPGRKDAETSRKELTLNHPRMPDLQ